MESFSTFFLHPKLSSNVTCKHPLEKNEGKKSVIRVFFLPSHEHEKSMYWQDPINKIIINHNRIKTFTKNKQRIKERRQGKKLMLVGTKPHFVSGKKLF